MKKLYRWWRVIAKVAQALGKLDECIEALKEAYKSLVEDEGESKCHPKSDSN